MWKTKQNLSCCSLKIITYVLLSLMTNESSWEILIEAPMPLCLHFNGTTMYHLSKFYSLFDWLIHDWEMFVNCILKPTAHFKQGVNDFWSVERFLCVGTGTRLSVLCCCVCCVVRRSEAQWIMVCVWRRPEKHVNRLHYGYNGSMCTIRTEVCSLMCVGVRSHFQFPPEDTESKTTEWSRKSWLCSLTAIFVCRTVAQCDQTKLEWFAFWRNGAWPLIF